MLSLCFISICAFMTRLRAAISTVSRGSANHTRSHVSSHTLFYSLCQHIQHTSNIQMASPIWQATGQRTESWAENRILGGIVLFDHFQTWDKESEPNLYIHSTRARITGRICQLLDEQQDSLLLFLLSDMKRSPTDCSLPILPSSHNRVRINVAHAIPAHKMYRDVWERSPPRGLSLSQRRRQDRCVSEMRQA